MTVGFYGGQTAGLVVLLGLSTKRDVRIQLVIPQDAVIDRAARLLKLKIGRLDQLDNTRFITHMSRSLDVLFCCHGRKILRKELTDALRCINFHPCLFKYKGAYPVRKLLEHHETDASVGAHFMTEKIDRGPLLHEIFVELDPSQMGSECDVYNQLYPTYLELLAAVLRKIR